ncbi:MAG: sulfatase-like hydrolase/transferase [Pirellulaceae bacterium]|nr:sulfatase-like hydrolase/transferase [Pirellulaceae bacterium]
MVRSWFAIVAIFGASYCNAIDPATSISVDMPTELLLNDSRLLSQSKSAIMLTDFSKAMPTSALTLGRREKGKWKILPFATADFSGSAISTYAFTDASKISLSLPAVGWHAVYLGVSTVSTGFREAKNGLMSKLSDEQVFKRMANNVAHLPNRVDVIQEQWLTVANLDGQAIEIASLPNLPATICYVKLVPLTVEEVAKWMAAQSPTATTSRTSIATFDGHSWIWPYDCRTTEDLLANFRGYEGTDIGKWWFQVLGADLVTYRSNVGNVPGEETIDFPTREHASFVESVKELHRRGINPLRVAREEARRQGVEFHIMLRPAGWKASIPFEETFDSRFYEDHPEWRCIDRDGTPTMYMSYAYPQVRRHLLDVFRETLELQPEGVGFLFNRGMPMILWENAFCERFQKMHGIDAHSVAEEDSRILATRAAIMTDFMQEVRDLLDEAVRNQNRTQRYKISLGTFSKESDNQKFGFDLPNWIKRGLVDDLAVAWFAHHTSFAQPDMAYYKRMTTGTNVGVYPFVVSWKTGKPIDLCKKVSAFYEAGATGIAIWDTSVEAGWKETLHGNVFDTLGRLGMLFTAITECRAIEAARPNIVLIVADDLGFSDLGCYGGEIRTPHLDRLAAEGMQFTQFYNCGVCNITRAALFTGLHPRFGKGGLLRSNMPTLAEVLLQVGYATTMSGKWHLGGAPNRPIDRGFEEYYGVMIGAVNYFNPSLPDPPGMKHAGPSEPFVHNATPITSVPPGYYATDAFADHAIEQIARLSKNGKPFFLHLAFTAPHYPLHALPEDIEKYRGCYSDGYTVLREERYRRLIELGLVSKEWKLPDPDPKLTDWRYDLSPKPWDSSAEQSWESAKMEVYAAMVDRMDQAIGRVLASLKECDAEENTLVIFFSDNGACASNSSSAAYQAYQAGVSSGSEESYILGGPGWASVQSSPFRRYKTWTYEGGISTPMIVRWPGKIRAGSRTDAVCHLVDWMPTFVEVSGAEYPKQIKGNLIPPLEGISLESILRGQNHNLTRQLGWSLYGSRAYRSGKWKSVWGVSTKRWELYDMQADRTEMRDLSTEHPALTSQLASDWRNWADRSEIP